MKSILISGGDIQSDFALEFLEKNQEAVIIAVDRGMEFCRTHGILPQAIVGDFDSGNPQTLSYFKERKVLIKQLFPEKDDSDTQSALNLAISLGADEVMVLGGTGSRVDHLWANVQLLALAMELGVNMSLWDANNYISIRKKGFILKKNDQFGKFISFFSLGDFVEELTLVGFKYPLVRHRLTNTDSGLSISNEIWEENAHVSFVSGTLVMIQSRD